MIMTRRASGYGVAPKTIAAIESCVMDIWLIPQANKPFAIDSIFAGRGYTYPEEFRRVFLETYRKGKRVGLFDLWICRKAG